MIDRESPLSIGHLNTMVATDGLARTSTLR